MNPKTCFLTAMLLVSALAPLAGADGDAPADECAMRNVLAAVGTELQMANQTCLTDAEVADASRYAAESNWLYDADPANICTMLWWTQEGVVTWYGAPCYAEGRLPDPASIEPCSTLIFEEGPGRDLCGSMIVWPKLDTSTFVGVLLSKVPNCGGTYNRADSKETECNIDPPNREVVLLETVKECLAKLIGGVSSTSRSSRTATDCEGGPGPIRECPFPATGTPPACFYPCPEGPGYDPVCTDGCADDGKIGVEPACVGGRCNDGYTGVPPACIRNLQRCPPDEVGLYEPACVPPPPPPVPCGPGEIGLYEPACVKEPTPCPSNEIGLYEPGCVPPPPPPVPCGPGEIGLYEPACVKEPTRCPSNELGLYEPGCVPPPPPPVPCDQGDVGLYKPACVDHPCPQGASTNPPSACGKTLPTVPDDQDRDGFKDSQEQSAGSHMNSASSTPITDDDGDGTLNFAEPLVLVAQGRAGCTGAFGVVYDPVCGGFGKPPGVTGALGTYQNKVFAWDFVCISGASGSYSACKSSSNYAVNPTKYTGTMASDGYGYRYVADVPTAQPVSVPIVGLCSVATQDNDGDGIPVYRFCMQTLTVYPNGSLSTAENSFLVGLGDPNDSDPLNAGVEVQEGPYATAERHTGDGIHYKLGAKIAVGDLTLDYVFEGYPDAGQLPLTRTVPTGDVPRAGPDADGDGLPAYYDVPMRQATVNDDQALTITYAPANAQRVPFDDDANPLIPDGSLPIEREVVTGADAGPDADRDTVPDYVVVHWSLVSIGGPGGVTVTPSRDQTLDGDPDDADPNNPRPSNQVPINVPGFDQDVGVPEQETPGVPERDVVIPRQYTPATCTVDPCTQPTPVTGPIQLPPTTIGPVESPDTPDVCIPMEPIDLPAPLPDVPCILFVPGQPSQELFPGMDAGDILTVPAQTVPAVCGLGPVCLPPTHIPGTGGTVTTPGVDSETTPAVSVTVIWTGATGFVDPKVGTYGIVPPIELPGGIKICPDGCPFLPLPADVQVQGSFTVIVAVGSEVHSITVPITV